MKIIQFYETKEERLKEFKLLWDIEKEFTSNVSQWKRFLKEVPEEHRDFLTLCNVDYLCNVNKDALTIPACNGRFTGSFRVTDIFKLFRKFKNAFSNHNEYHYFIPYFIYTIYKIAEYGNVIRLGNNPIEKMRSFSYSECHKVIDTNPDCKVLIDKLALYIDRYNIDPDYVLRIHNDRQKNELGYIRDISIDSHTGKYIPNYTNMSYYLSIRYRYLNHSGDLFSFFKDDRFDVRKRFDTKYVSLINNDNFFLKSIMRRDTFQHVSVPFSDSPYSITPEIYEYGIKYIFLNGDVPEDIFTKYTDLILTAFEKSPRALLYSFDFDPQFDVPHLLTFRNIDIKLSEEFLYKIEMRIKVLMKMHRIRSIVSNTKILQHFLALKATINDKMNNPIHTPN